MGRKIIMKGHNALYIEHRGMNATPDQDREILMEGDEAMYQEYAYGQAAQSARRQEEPASGQDDEDRPQLTADGENVGHRMDTEELVERLKPLFYNNEADVRLFLKEIAGMAANDITDLVNRWVQDKRISDYGYSRKGTLWGLLNAAGLYTKSRQNWNRRVY